MLPSNASKVHVCVKKRVKTSILYIWSLCVYIVHVAKPYKGNHAATIGNEDETMT